MTDTVRCVCGRDTPADGTFCAYCGKRVAHDALGMRIVEDCNQPRGAPRFVVTHPDPDHREIAVHVPDVEEENA